MADFRATDKRAMSLKRGDRVIIKTGSLKNGWYVGTLHGKTGWIPATFVQAVPKESSTERGEENRLQSNFIAEEFLLRKDLRNLLYGSEFEGAKDVIFKLVVKNEEVKAHKLIVSSRNKVFQSLLANSQPQAIIDVDIAVSKKSFEGYLEFLYTGCNRQYFMTERVATKKVSRFGISSRAAFYFAEI